MDILSESPVTLPAARAFLPGRGGSRPDVKTLRRWVKDGVRTPGGVVRLEAACVGCFTYTSEAACRRFAAAVLAGRVPEAVPTERTPAQRNRASRKAEEELRREWKATVGV